MTERNIYADNYSCSFSDPSEFLDFLKERQDNSRWMVTPSRSIVFESLEKDTPMGDLYLKLYEHEGRAEIIADTMENTNHMAFWEAIGAAPTPMAWNEVYFALQSGNIAAEENAADTIVGANLFEVQDYLACTNHILYVNQISINKDSWDALDPAYQEALQEAVNLAIEEMRVQLVDIDTQNKEMLVENGMTLIEYEPEFFEEVLAVPAVQELYTSINEDTNGLAQTLQDELAAAAA